MAIKSVVPVLPSVRISKITWVPGAEPLPARLACVDLLRGVVMVLMALDHTRDFFSGLPFAPEDLARTSGPLFFTRFVTHFCAPAFFLLAGLGAYLSLSRGKSVAQVSRFFWTRGLWLLALGLTVVAYAWTFTWPFWHAGVLWALAWSMIAMAALVRLPIRWVALFGLVTIFAHNLLDKVDPLFFGKFVWLWFMLHCRGSVWIVPGKLSFFVLFSVIPWVGVMALGYALGSLLSKGNWRKPVFLIGAAATLMFVVLRAFHLYGNSQIYLQIGAPDAAGPWRVQPTTVLTVVSFFDTLKYPASLQFLLMTLGPLLMVLPWLDTINVRRRTARVLLMFGRVPLFFYVLHLYLIHSLAAWVAAISHQPIGWLVNGGPMLHVAPPYYRHHLPFIYGMWALVVVVMYVPCKMFMEFKQQHPNWWWLRYL